MLKSHRKVAFFVTKGFYYAGGPTIRRKANRHAGFQRVGLVVLEIFVELRSPARHPFKAGHPH